MPSQSETAKRNPPPPALTITATTTTTAAPVRYICWRIDDGNVLHIQKVYRLSLFRVFLSQRWTFWHQHIPRRRGSPSNVFAAHFGCHRLQQDFDIDLKQVVKAGCDPSTEQIAKLMDNPVGNLVLLFNQFDYSALKGPHSNGTRYLGKYSFMPTFPISIGEDWNLINRIPLSYVSAPVNAKAGNLIGMSPYGVLTDRDFPSVVNDPFDRTSGFGDMKLYLPK